MARNAETENDVLKRIVALLLALADLAERACGMPLPVRHLLLWILRPAETVAREFIGGSAKDAHWQQQAGAIAVKRGNDPADVIELAHSFRALALALKTLSREARRFAGAANQFISKTGAGLCRAGRHRLVHKPLIMKGEL